MIKQQTTPSHNKPLWDAYNNILNHYNTHGTAPKYNHTQTTTPFISCMIDLLSQLDQQQFTPYEKVGLFAAKEYWLNDAQELAPLLVRMGNVIESKITYRNPASDNRMSAHCQILAIDNDHFDEFPHFLESMTFAGLSIPQILETVKKHFSFITELQQP